MDIVKYAVADHDPRRFERGGEAGLGAKSVLAGHVGD
jgi:hypothetical protein